MLISEFYKNYKRLDQDKIIIKSRQHGEIRARQMYGLINRTSKTGIFVTRKLKDLKLKDFIHS